MNSIKSNSNNYILGNDVFGFSGYKNNSIPGPEIMLFENNLYKIFLFHQKSYEGYHLPQDSLGFLFKKNKLIFAIADGVSIVNGTNINNSGFLSYKLVSGLSEVNEDFNKLFLKTSNESKLIQPCASTFVGGYINLQKQEKHLSMSFVANSEDLGMNFVVSDKSFIDIPNHSYGFLPSEYKSFNYEIVLPEKFTLVMSSDGVYLKKNELLNILRLIEINSDIYVLLDEVVKILNPTKDDRSLMIIQSK